MSRTGIEADLLEAFGRRGCPVCRLVRASEERYWFFFLYEGFQDPDAGRDLRRSVGYCHRHLAQLVGRNDVFAAATLARASVRGALERLARRRWRPLDRAACPVCAHVGGMERLCLEALGRLVADDVGPRYDATDGVCFDHLEHALALGVPGRRRLVAHAARALLRHEEELERLIASFDYRREPAGRELAAAWKRAFAFLRGDPGPLI